MKARIYTAVLFSVVLVGGALWFRFAPDNIQNLGIITVHNASPETPSKNEFLAEDFLQTGTSTLPTASEPLTQTEIVGRQLFSDYISLKSRNQATSENLQILAEQYATNILSDDGGSSITSSQLTIIDDTDQNLINYNQRVKGLRTKYENLVDNMSPQKEFSDVMDPKFKIFINLVSAQYKKAADELMGFQVPVSLADNHARLVNNYLSSSRAAHAISEIETNPVSALAALKTQAENTVEEEELASNIKVLLISKGLFSNEL